MLTIRDHQTGDLFDPWAHLGEKRRRLLDRSWAGVFRKHLLEHLPVSELKPHFRVAMGRPTKDLHVAIGVLILQQLHDLTDAGAVEAVAFNIAWHYALDIRSESDAYFCERTLRNYRALAIEHGLDEIIFKNLTDRLIRALGVDASKQRLDSTAIRSAMRNLTRMGVVVETTSKFLRELARTHPGLHSAIDVELIRRHVGREGPGCFASTVPSDSKRRLSEVGRDLLDLVMMHRGTEAAELESFGLLERVLDEQFEVLPPDEHADGEWGVRIREPREITCDNVRNPADPDSSYNAHHGQGYMAQVMETYQEDDDTGHPVSCKPDLITHVAVHKMTVHDGQRLTPALDDVASRGVQPEMLLADTHYGSTANLKKARKRLVALVSPSMPAKGAKQGRLTLEQFKLDEQGQIIACPAGHAPVAVSAGAKRLQARFDQRICGDCPLKQSCVAQHGQQSRLQYTHECVAQRERRLNDRGESFRSHYRWRAGAEATMSRLKHQMNLGALRVRSMAAVTYVTVMRALGLNIRRCVAFEGVN